MNVLAYRTSTATLLLSSAFNSALAAQWSMPREMAQYFCQCQRPHEVSAKQIAQLMTPKVKNYFASQVPLYRHCQKRSLVDREYGGSPELCSAYNYYFDYLTRQYGGVPGGGSSSGSTANPIPPDWPSTFCMPYCE